MVKSKIEELDPNFAARDAADSELLWYNIAGLEVEGLGFEATGEYLCRLPLRAYKVVNDNNWYLAHNSAGVYVRFVTDAPRLAARWTLRHESLAMPHMPALGVSGLDLYVLADGTWKWAAVGIPQQFPDNSVELLGNLESKERQFMLYLPLYNGVNAVALGLPAGARLAKAPEWPGGPYKPIVFYGTSITQGGCASRPGMVHTSILSRRLQRPVINLGFSGSAWAEPEFAQFLAELEPSVYVLNPLPNMSPTQVEERIEPFVKIIRAARPATPIVLVEDFIRQSAHLRPAPDEKSRQGRMNIPLKAAYQRLLDAGVENLIYFEGTHLYGHDWESTVDGAHASDLGFMRMADAYEPVLRPLI